MQLGSNQILYTFTHHCLVINNAKQLKHSKFATSNIAAHTIVVEPHVLYCPVQPQVAVNQWQLMAEVNLP